MKRGTQPERDLDPIQGIVITICTGPILWAIAAVLLHLIAIR